MIDTTAITAITPITIPSSVRSDRRRFARNEASAMKTASAKFIGHREISHKRHTKHKTYFPFVLCFSARSAEFLLEEPDLLLHRLFAGSRSGFGGRFCRPHWLPFWGLR